MISWLKGLSWSFYDIMFTLLENNIGRIKHLSENSNFLAIKISRALHGLYASIY